MQRASPTSCCRIPPATPRRRASGSSTRSGRRASRRPTRPSSSWWAAAATPNTTPCRPPSAAPPPRTAPPAGRAPSSTARPRCSSPRPSSRASSISTPGAVAHILLLGWCRLPTRTAHRRRSSPRTGSVCRYLSPFRGWTLPLGAFQSLALATRLDDDPLLPGGGAVPPGTYSGDNRPLSSAVLRRLSFVVPHSSRRFLLPCCQRSGERRSLGLLRRIPRQHRRSTQRLLRVRHGTERRTQHQEARERDGTQYHFDGSLQHSGQSVERSASALMSETQPYFSEEYLLRTAQRSPTMPLLLVRTTRTTASRHGRRSPGPWCVSRASAADHAGLRPSVLRAT
mmetsp:Transcript_27397/g.109732  ORF Transcript_27397/g.109732 Transcript_27397/m.109732 type:complete len:340 (+) Transcript_27397:1372-2391(+)